MSKGYVLLTSPSFKGNYWVRRKKITRGIYGMLLPIFGQNVDPFPWVFLVICKSCYSLRDCQNHHTRICFQMDIEMIAPFWNDWKWIIKFSLFHMIHKGCILFFINSMNFTMLLFLDACLLMHKSDGLGDFIVCGLFRLVKIFVFLHGYWYNMDFLLKHVLSRLVFQRGFSLFGLC